MTQITITDPESLRRICDDPALISYPTHLGESDGHKFLPGETRTLVGLESFPEFNGQNVTITAIRKDGSHGKAYYIVGDINKFLNWVFEYRLQ